MIVITSALWILIYAYPWFQMITKWKYPDPTDAFFYGVGALTLKVEAHAERQKRDLEAKIAAGRTKK